MNNMFCVPAFYNIKDYFFTFADNDLISMCCGFFHGRNQVLAEVRHRLLLQSTVALMVAAKAATTFFSSAFRSVACALA